MESYAEKDAGAGVGKRKVYEPFIPSAFRQKLVDTLKETHAAMLEPPEEIRSVPEKAKAWKPPVKREIDWSSVMTARGDKVGSVVGGAAAPHAGHPSESTEATGGQETHNNREDEAEPECLTIGVIGMYISRRVLALYLMHPQASLT